MRTLVITVFFLFILPSFLSFEYFHDAKQDSEAQNKHTNEIDLKLKSKYASFLKLDSEASIDNFLSISVMSFNCRFDNPEDLIFRWPFRRSYFVRVVKIYGKDIFGSQEMLPH